MTWLYTYTHSIFLIQLMHIVSTGSLVVLGAFGVTPAQETTWYAIYAGALWLIILLIVFLTLYTTQARKEA